MAKAKRAAVVADRRKATGLKWVGVGQAKPRGVQIVNNALQIALLKKTTEYSVEGKGGRREVRTRMHDKFEAEFTETEWAAFKVSDVPMNAFVQADATRFFVTAERAAEDRQQVRMSKELIEASRNGDAREVSQLIDAKANVNFPDKCVRRHSMALCD